MPIVTVWPTLNGSPIASTTSPTRAWSDWPNVIGVRPVGDDAHHREVGVRIGADDLAGDGAPVVQGDLDVGHALDHVVVGEDVALAAHDDARAERELGLGRQVEALAEEALEDRVVEQRVARGFTWRVAEMFTTDGIALRAASLNELAARRVRLHRDRRRTGAALADLDHRASATRASRASRGSRRTAPRA